MVISVRAGQRWVAWVVSRCCRLVLVDSGGTATIPGLWAGPGGVSSPLRKAAAGIKRIVRITSPFAFALSVPDYMALSRLARRASAPGRPVLRAKIVLAARKAKATPGCPPARCQCGYRPQVAAPVLPAATGLLRSA
jgi:hypothetical protein